MAAERRNIWTGGQTLRWQRPDTLSFRAGINLCAKFHLDSFGRLVSDHECDRQTDRRTLRWQRVATLLFRGIDLQEAQQLYCTLLPVFHVQTRQDSEAPATCLPDKERTCSSQFLNPVWMSRAVGDPPTCTLFPLSHLKTETEEYGQNMCK